MKTKLQFATALVSALLLFGSCKKEGPPGKDGNANVKSSTVTFSNWNWDNTNFYSYADFTWSELTPSIVNSGAVLMYLNTNLGWVELPRTIYPTSGYSESQSFYYNVGTFKIKVQDSDFLPPSPALSTWTIKIIAMESTVRKANPNLDWSNYEAVKLQLNLPD